MLATIKNGELRHWQIPFIDTGQKVEEHEGGALGYLFDSIKVQPPASPFFKGFFYLKTTEFYLQKA
jgi:hypothetical protein